MGFILRRGPAVSAGPYDRVEWSGIMSDSRPQAAPGSGLHQCAFCRDDFVVLVWREPVEGDSWRLLLRCGQCETYRDVVVSTEVAKAFERDLERGAREIRIALDRLDHERMEAETEAFVAALRHDLIDAGDFTGR